MMTTATIRRAAVGAFVSAVLGMAQQAAAAENESGAFWREWRLSTGVDYSKGDYGQEIDTEILYVPVTGRIVRNDWMFKLTVPYIRIKGPGDVVGGGEGGIVVGGGQREVTTESGLGDIVASVTYTIPSLAEQGTFVDLIGKVKFGTADEDKLLGTGENDYYLQLDLAKSYGRWTPLGTLGYRWVGDPPGFDLNNVFYASVGTAYRVSRPTSIGLLYDFREAASPTADDASELFGYVNYRFNPTWSLTGYGATGFTDGSPDWNLGLQINYSRQ